MSIPGPGHVEAVQHRALTSMKLLCFELNGSGLQQINSPQHKKAQTDVVSYSACDEGLLIR